ncbi:hypothetical protein [Microbispora sp. H13382]|uniref:hypothetical protein n=1 Tax=Microbispora sp. H13382 TaxID=2729112 RepID=UPI001602283F|nr:hypothetical protein [Microbispora sp. H13382]
MAVQAVIFDYKTLLMRPGTPQAQAARGMLEWLRDRGLRWCVFTTDPFSENYRQDFGQLGYPEPDLLVDLGHIASGKRRGSPDWVDTVTAAFELERRELLYVGCNVMDWRTAINSGVLYLHACWAGPMPSGTTSLTADSPQEIPKFTETFLTGPPSWSHRLDQDHWSLRSLLPASATLPSTSPARWFALQDVFTYDKTIKINNDDARDVLMLFVLANAYLEGLIPANPYICVYPGSKKGKVSAQLKDYLDKAAKLFHGYYRDDLLVRMVDAPDTSIERARARRQGGTADVSIATQATTVHLGPKYRGKLKGKTVVVFDDFTTHGMSLEWARLLLAAAGVGRIVMLTVGKYGTGHTRYELKDGKVLDPYVLNALTADDFSSVNCRPIVDQAAEGRLSTLISISLGTTGH